MLAVNFVLFVMLAYAGVDAVSICPVNSTSTHPVRLHGSWCYQFHLRETREFSAAQAECRSQGGSEVIIRDADTQQFLYNAIRGEFHYDGVVWIGLNDVSQEGTFRWVDGSPMTFSYWDSGQPGNLFGSLEDCVAMDMSKGGHWHDYRCEDFLVFRNPHPFICQFPLKYIGSTPTMRPDTTTAESTVAAQTDDVVTTAPTTTVQKTTVPMTTVPESTVAARTDDVVTTAPTTTVQKTTVPATTTPMTSVPTTTS